jgi:hypothetical protein
MSSLAFSLSSGMDRWGGENFELSFKVRYFKKRKKQGLLQTEKIREN